MTFEIEVAGRARAVSVERIEPGRFRVVLDGRAHVVNAARIGDFGLSLLLEGDAGASREIQVVPAGAGDMLATLDGRTVHVGINGRRSRRGSADAAGPGAGDRPVLAPMPGRVVRVLVGPGDEVAARQPLVVVEAMKMENELRSPRAGTVKEVTVSAGMSVDAGRVLVTIA
jgi:acetyl/propionyl-CoA carboxylase alpha subunit